MPTAGLRQRLSYRQGRSRWRSLPEAQRLPAQTLRQQYKSLTDRSKE